MNSNEYFRLGLEYLFEFEPKGAKTRIANCAKVRLPNLSAMVKGSRPFPEEARHNIAKCFNLTVRDIEKTGKDIYEGIEGSVQKEMILVKKTFMPAMSEPPDLNVYAIDIETLDTSEVGEGWTVDEGSIIAQFNKVPCYEARYLFKKKQGVDDSVNTDEGEEK